MPTVKTDNRFARAVLSVVPRSIPCKTALANSGALLNRNVILPLLARLEDSLPPTSRPLNKDDQAAITFFINQHSKEGKQWGGSMPHVSKKALNDDPEKQIVLLSGLAERLSRDHIMRISDTTTLAEMMKAMTDSCYCYVEHLSGLPKDAYQEIKPSPQEIDIRIKRVDLRRTDGEFEVPHLATTYGIGTGPHDIAPATAIPLDAERAHDTGKSTFSPASTITAMELTIQQYNAIKIQLAAADMGSEQYRQLEGALSKAAERMQFYHIPLEESERLTPIESHHPPRPSIEKLARWGGEPGEPLPLIATASGTTARTLIALEHLGAFRTETGDFDADSAQYVATALSGTLVHGGHHSVLEVGEIYNRLLDYHDILELDESPKPETHYYRQGYFIGDYNSLVPASMRRDMVIAYNSEKQQEQLAKERERSARTTFTTSSSSSSHSFLAAKQTAMHDAMGAFRQGAASTTHRATTSTPLHYSDILTNETYVLKERIASASREELQAFIDGIEARPYKSGSLEARKAFVLKGDAERHLATAPSHLERSRAAPLSTTHRDTAGYRSSRPPTHLATSRTTDLSSSPPPLVHRTSPSAARQTTMHDAMEALRQGAASTTHRATTSTPLHYSDILTNETYVLKERIASASREELQAFIDGIEAHPYKSGSLEAKKAFVLKGDAERCLETAPSHKV